MMQESLDFFTGHTACLCGVFVSSLLEPNVEGTASPLVQVVAQKQLEQKLTPFIRNYDYFCLNTILLKI